MALTITLRDDEHLPSSTIEVNDSDEQLLIAALHELAAKKREAFKVVNAAHPGQFTEDSFGIARIQLLIAAIEGEDAETLGLAAIEKASRR